MSKYKAVRTEVDGVVFHSKREAARYGELQMLRRSGIIHNLAMQVHFGLSTNDPHGQPQRVGEYVADFVYQTKEGKTVIEDCKGFQTPQFKWKARHFELQYGMRILLT